MAHSIGQFFGMSGLALDVQGKHIGFIGDRVSGQHPVPFILPSQNTWAWQKTKYVNNTATFTAYYNIAENRDKLWSTGGGDQDVVKAALPRLLALPTSVPEFLVTQGGPCLPYQL